MTLLLATHPAFLLHDAGAGHPERPDRLRAVHAGISSAGLDEALVIFEPKPATAADIERVHPGAYLPALREFTEAGGGLIDADTAASRDSWDALLLAAGAGLDAVRRLEEGGERAAFLAVRPPGHHATPHRPMGFCLVNNVSVTAASLIERGERVMIVDYDAHHGNGTQEVFYGDPRVLYVSFHEWPLYPGTGAIEEIGREAGRGFTVNIPVPTRATGDVYRAGIDEVIVPLAEAWHPTWLLISAGFDAHRRDPITGLALASGDYADITRELARLVPAGRMILFLEGGYDLEGLAHSVGATLAAVLDVEHRPEPATSGGPGREVVDQVRDLHARLDL